MNKFLTPFKNLDRMIYMKACKVINLNFMEGFSEKTNGIEANRVNATQLKVVMTKAWRTDKRKFPALDVSVMAPPIKRVTPEEMANICQSGLPAKASTMAGTIMLRARAHNKIPTIKKIGR